MIWGHHQRNILNIYVTFKVNRLTSNFSFQLPPQRRLSVLYFRFMRQNPLIGVYCQICHFLSPIQNLAYDNF